MHLARTITAGLAATTIVVPLTVAPAASASPAAKVRSGTSLAAPAAVAYGGNLHLQGIVGRAGTAVRIPGARVILQRATPGHTNWTSFTSTVTNAKGQYGFYPVPVGRPFSYRVVWPGNATYASSVSPVRTPAVRAVASLLSLRDDSIYVDPGNEVVAQAMVYPGRTDRPVFLQRYDAAANVFRNVGFARAPSDRKFTMYARVGGSVSYYRIYSPAFGGYASAVSPAHRFAHYTPRGSFVRPLVATGGTNNSVFSVWPTSKDPDRRTAGAYAARGGSSWADINVTGCKWVTAWFEGGAGMGGRTRVQVIVGGKVVVNTSVYGDGQNDWHTYTLNVLGRRTIRMQVSDIDTKNGPRAILRARTLCAS